MKRAKKKVYWFAGLPGLLHWYEVDTLMMIARHTRPEYICYRYPPLKVVRLRPMMIERFMMDTKDPFDTLVMIDVDHDHPPNIVNKLVEPDKFGVYMSLTFKRAHTIPVASVMNYDDGWDKKAGHASQIKLGEILECDRGGFAAVAVQRRVFSAILDLGYDVKETFMYKGQRDCDEWFARLCQEAGFKQYVNTALVSPHNRDERFTIGLPEWDKYMRGKGQGGIVNAE